MPLLNIVVPQEFAEWGRWAQELCAHWPEAAARETPNPQCTVQYYLPYTTYRGRISPAEAVFVPPLANLDSAAERELWAACRAVEHCVCADEDTARLLCEGGVSATTVAAPPCAEVTEDQPVLTLALVECSGVPWEALSLPGIALSFGPSKPANAWSPPPLADLRSVLQRADCVLAPDHPVRGPFWMQASLAHGRSVVTPAREWAAPFPHAAYTPGDAESLKRTLAALADERRRLRAPAPSTWQAWRRAHQELFDRLAERWPCPAIAALDAAQADSACGVWWRPGMAPAVSLRAAKRVSALLGEGIRARAVQTPDLAAFPGSTVYAIVDSAGPEVLRLCHAARATGKRVILEIDAGPDGFSGVEGFDDGAGDMALLPQTISAASHIVFRTQGALSAARRLGAYIASWSLLPQPENPEETAVEQKTLAAIVAQELALPAPPSFPASTTLYVDVTASAERMRKGLPPSGIPRVEYLIARHIEQAWPGAVRFIGWHATRRAWIPITREEFFADAHAALLTPGGDDAPRRRASHPAALVDFVPGSTAVFMGGTWLTDVNYSAYMMDLRAIKALRRLRIAACIHDVIRARIPYLYPPHLTESFTKNLAHLLETADVLLTVSQCAAADIRWAAQEYAGINAAPRVIREGDGLPEEEPGDCPEELRTDLNGGSFVLCVSALDARKNHALLWRLWRSLLDERGSDIPHMVWVGSPSHKTAELLSIIEADEELRSRLHVYHNLGDSALRWLYENCLFTLYPSWYEGWGLPVAESLAQGKICLAARATSIPEIAGELADLLPPHDLAAWRDRVLLYTLSEPARCARESQIASSYTPQLWQETARQTAAFLEAPTPWTHPCETIGYGSVADFALESAPGTIPARKIALSGWSRFEQSGCWTEGPRVHFGFVMDQRKPGATVLLVEAAPYRCPEGEPLRVSALLGKTPCASWKLTRPGIYALPLAYGTSPSGPWEVLAGFDIENPRPPGHGGSEDDAENRALGIKVRAMRVVQLVPCAFGVPVQLESASGVDPHALVLPDSLIDDPAGEKTPRPASSVILALPHLAATDLALHLHIAVDGLGAEQTPEAGWRVSVFADGRACGTWPLEEGAGAIEAAFVLAREAVATGLIPLSARLEPATQAAQAGLGLRLTLAEIGPLQESECLETCEPGTEMRFGTAGNAAACLVQGLSARAKEGVWLSLGRSLFAMRLGDAPAGGLELFIEGEPAQELLGGGLRLEAAINGLAFLARTLREPGMHRMTAHLPGDALKTGGPFVLELWARPANERARRAAKETHPHAFLLKRMAVRLPFGAAPAYAMGSRVVVGGSQADAYLVHGWAIPQDDSRWTLGPAARFACTPAPPPKSGLTLRMQCRALVADALPEQPVTVKANGLKAGTVRVRGGFEEHALFIPPGLVGQSESLTLDFEMGLVRSPAQLGLGTDARQLGILVQWISLEEGAAREDTRESGAGPGAPMELGRAAFLGEGGLPGGAFLSGWSAPQDESRWTVGSSAVLCLRIEPGAPQDLTLAVEARAFIAGDLANQPVKVFVNGTETAHWIFEEDLAQMAASVPAEAIGPDGLLYIEFRPERPVSPHGLGAGADKRELGILVRRIALAAAGADADALDVLSPSDADAGDKEVLLPVSFGKGWAVETGGLRTMTAPEAEISVSLPKLPFAGIELQGGVRLAEGSGRVFARVHLLVEGAAASTVLAFDSFRTCHCVIPADALGPGPRVSIRISDDPSALRPCANSDPGAAGRVQWQDLRVVLLPALAP